MQSHELSNPISSAPFIRPLFLLSLFSLLVTPQVSFAQEYVPLSPNSDLVCIYLTNGKTKLVRETGSGYKNVKFKKAIRQTAKDLRKARGKYRQTTKLLRQFQKQAENGGTIPKLRRTEVKKIAKILQIDKADLLSRTLPDLIAKVESSQENYRLGILFETEIIELIKKCKKRNIPSPGTFETRFVNILQHPYNAERGSSGTGYVVVFAVIPAYIGRTAPLLCYDHPAQGVRYESASSDPCFTETLSSNDPDTCDNLIEYDDKGNPNYYLALLEKRNFFFQERAGGISFNEAASIKEADLRTNPIYLWNDSVRYATVDSVNDCKQSLFED